MGLLTFEYTRREPKAPRATPLLWICDLSVRLGQRLVLDDINLDVHEGDHVKISGPNGSGKSTLLNAIMGVVPLAAGRLEFRGVDLRPLATHERVKLGLRCMRQRDNVFPSLTVRENLQLALGRDGYSRFRDSFPDWAAAIPAEKRAGMLSGGQKQQLAWGAAALSDVPLLLADEPSTGIFEPRINSYSQGMMLVEHSPNGADQ